MLREEAYRIVQAHAMQAWENEGDFRAAIEADTDITRHLDPSALAESFSVSRQLANVDQIFERVFAKRLSPKSESSKISCIDFSHHRLNYT